MLQQENYKNNVETYFINYIVSYAFTEYFSQESCKYASLY